MLKNKSIRKCKKTLRRERTWSLYCGQVRTGLVMLFRHLCTDCHQTSHALKICLGRFLSTFRPATLVRSGGNNPSSRFSWRNVWTGVKCNFCSAQLHNWYVDGKLLISRVRMWNFTRIRRKTRKLWLSISPARRQRPATTYKKVWTTTFLRRNSTSGTSLDSSRSRKLRYAVSAGLAKR